MICQECGCQIDVEKLNNHCDDLFQKINEGLYLPTELEESVFLEKICYSCFQKLNT